MAGSAVQYAPQSEKTATVQNGGAGQRRASGAAQPTKAKIPMAAGIAGLVVMVALSLPIGNYRALSKATPKDFLRQGDVKSIVEDRIGDAGNALTIAKRAGLDETIYADVDAAVAQMRAAKTAREISRADQKLTTAVSTMTADAFNRLAGEDQYLLSRAADNFAEQGSFLRQEAREFNRKAEKAEALYEKLPTRALFAEPDVFEGI